MHRRRQSERGYALLLVFALAATAAVLFYLELPRVAFEHQRDKETLLVERGEQYVRAIQLYVKKFNKYPQSIEELESTQNLRFLRRRYKDPLTGSDEWRLIHIDGAGQYTDSKVHKPKGANEQEKKGPSLLASNIEGIGNSAQYVQQPGEKTSTALQRRASDRISPGTPGAAGVLGPGAASGSDSAADSGSRSGDAGATQPVVMPAPGLEGQQNANPFQMPRQAGVNPALPGQLAGAQSGTVPGQAGSAQTGATQSAGSGGSFGFGGGFGFSGGSAQSSPSTPGSRTAGGTQSGGFGSGGVGSGGQTANRAGLSSPSNQAIMGIQNLLTGSRMNPSAATGMGSNPTGGGIATNIQGGIAGVASKREGVGILVYNEKSDYSEWEFLYDMKKELSSQGMNANSPGGQQRQTSGSSSSGFSFGGSGTSSGGTGGSGFGSSGFGSSGTSSSGSSSGFGFGGSGSTTPPKAAPGSLGK